MNYEITYDEHGTGVVNPLPSTEELQKYYSEKYYQMPRGQYSGSYTSSEISYFHFFNELIYFIAKSHASKNITTFDMSISLIILHRLTLMECACLPKSGEE